MKKLMAIAGIVAFSCSLVLAQAPDQVKQKFKTDYPNAMGAVWKSEKDNSHRVVYTENKVESALVYDQNGNVLSRQTVVKDAAIPVAITEYYKTRTANSKEYAPSYTVWQTTDKDGNVTYFSEYSGRQTYFDKEGKVLTRQGVAEGELEKQDGKTPIDK